MRAGDHHREDENGINGRRDRRSAKRSSIQATWTYRRCLKSSEPSKRIDADINTVIPLPFQGLRYFDEDQSDLFFGRDDQIREVTEKLRQSRFVAVIGNSGSGKSSLVRAGLFPALRSGLLRGVSPH